MTPSEYVGSKGWPHRRVGDELMAVCPFCKEKDCFYINTVTGVWLCHRGTCARKGTFRQLREAMGDELRIIRSPEPAVTGPSLVEWKSKFNPGKELEGACRAWLADRKLSSDWTDKFGVRFSTLGTDPAIYMPYIHEDRVVLTKARSICNKKNQVRRPAGAASPLFGLHLLDRSLPFVILVEGELDAISGYEYGLKNVLSSSIGAQFDPTWTRQLEWADVIVIGYDNDPAGEDGASKAIQNLGAARCRRVLWPKKDLNECLTAGIPAHEIFDLVGGAKDLPPADLKDGPTVYDELLADKGEGLGRPSGFKGLTEALGGIRAGEITVLVGDTGSGKSTFGINLVLDAMDAGEPALIISSEMNPKRVMSKMASMIAKADYLQHTDEMRGAVRLYLESHPVMFLDVHGEVPKEVMAETVGYCCERLGVRFVLMDHLHFFVKASAEDERAQLDAYMKAIVGVKMKHRPHILLICHSRATKSDDEKVSMSHIKGTSGIKQDADNVMSIRRNGQDKLGMERPVTITVHKNRYAGELGDFKLDYTTSSQRYSDYVKASEPEKPGAF